MNGHSGIENREINKGSMWNFHFELFFLKIALRNTNVHIDRKI